MQCNQIKSSGSTLYVVVDANVTNFKLYLFIKKNFLGGFLSPQPPPSQPTEDDLLLRLIHTLASTVLCCVTSCSTAPPHWLVVKVAIAAA